MYQTYDIYEMICRILVLLLYNIIDFNLLEGENCFCIYLSIPICLAKNKLLSKILLKFLKETFDIL